MAIPASELILNPDHSVYHLQLRNGELAPRVITVGDPGRVDLIRSYLDTVELEKRHREFYTVTGRMGAQRLTVLATGIGTDNIDVVLNELQLVQAYDLEKRRPLPNPEPLRVLRLGTSGALQEEVPVGSLWMSEEALGLDGLLPFYAHNYPLVDLGLPGIPPAVRVQPSDELKQAFTRHVDGGGLTLTAAGFYAPPGGHLLAAPRHKDWLQKVVQQEVGGRKPSNLEMETAGIYGLGGLLGMHTLSLSVILANRFTGDFSARPEEGIKRLIEAGLEGITSLR